MEAPLQHSNKSACPDVPTDRFGISSSWRRVMELPRMSHLPTRHPTSVIRFPAARAFPLTTLTSLCQGHPPCESFSFPSEPWPPLPPPPTIPLPPRSCGQRLRGHGPETRPEGDADGWTECHVTPGSKCHPPAKHTAHQKAHSRGTQAPVSAQIQTLQSLGVRAAGSGLGSGNRKV